MKLFISLSSAPFALMDRVAVRLDTDKWQVGSVHRVGTSISVKYDNGDTTALIKASDFKHVRVITVEPGLIRREPITDKEVKLRCA